MAADFGTLILDETPGAVARRRLDHGAARHESVRGARDGTPVYIDSTSKVLRAAKLVAARFDGFLELMPDASIMVDVGGRIVLAMRQAEKLFNYERRASRGDGAEFPVEISLSPIELVGRCQGGPDGQVGPPRVAAHFNEPGRQRDPVHRQRHRAGAAGHGHGGQARVRRHQRGR
jgi:PAS domain-containing protein